MRVTIGRASLVKDADAAAHERVALALAQRLLRPPPTPSPSLQHRPRSCPCCNTRLHQQPVCCNKHAACTTHLTPTDSCNSAPFTATTPPTLLQQHPLFAETAPSLLQQRPFCCNSTPFDPFAATAPFCRNINFWLQQHPLCCNSIFTATAFYCNSTLFTASAPFTATSLQQRPFAATAPAPRLSRNL